MAGGVYANYRVSYVPCGAELIDCIAAMGPIVLPIIVYNYVSAR